MAAHRIASFIEEIQSAGRLTFSEAELSPHGASEKATSEALRRLQASGKIRRVSRKSDFFVIVPPEFRAQGAPPVDWWLDDLMRHLDTPYYVGLLTAAQWHGSSHFAVMETQVATPTNRKPITVGQTKIRFFASSKVAVTPVETRTNMWAKVIVSTPAATLGDLAEHRFGPDRLAMAAAEMLPHLTSDDIVSALDASGSVPTAQRLGFILEHVNAPALADAVEAWIGDRPRRTVELDPSAQPRSEVATRWRVSVNSNLESAA